MWIPNFNLVTIEWLCIDLLGWSEGGWTELIGGQGVVVEVLEVDWIGGCEGVDVYWVD